MEQERGQRSRIVDKMALLQELRIVIRKGPRHARGFTLLELLVVVGVMALLIGLLFPAMRKAREASRATVCVANLKHIGAGIFAYANENSDHGPSIMAAMGSTAPRTLISRPGQLVNLGLLLHDASVQTDNFFCPSQQEYNYPTDLKYLETGNVGSSYAYSVHLPAQQSPRLASVRYLALATDDFTARLGADWGVGKYSHHTLYNILHSDGSAIGYSDPDTSIFRQAVHWDDETDDVSYFTLYNQSGDTDLDPDQYGSALDIFRAWHAFCYNVEDDFGATEKSDEP